MSINPLSRRKERQSAASGPARSGISGQAYFFITLGVGAAFLLYTTYVSTSLIAVILGSAAIMIPYCNHAYRQARHFGSAEQVADSCYYLGFLMTLIGLCISLFELGADSKAPATLGVVARFGASIVTTLVGMMARILIVQFRADPVSAPREAEARVAESMLRVAKELEESVKQFEDIRRNTVNNINQATKAAETRINNAVEKQLEITEKFTLNAFKRHASILDDLEKNLSKVAIDLSPMHEGMDRIMESISAQMSRLNGVLIKIGDAGEETERRWGGLKSRLDVIAGSLDSLANSADDLNRAGSALTNTSERLDAAAGVLGQTRDVVEHLSSTLKGSEELVERMMRDINSRLEDLSALSQQVREERASAIDATDAVYRGLRDALALITRELSGAIADDV